MKILLAGQAYYRKDNGQAAFTIQLAEGLRQAGHEVLVLAPSDQRGRPYRAVKNGVVLQTVPALYLFYNVNVTGLATAVVGRALREFAPDVVHLQDHYFLCRTVRRLASQAGIPLVGTNHFLPQNLTANLPISQPMRNVLNKGLWWHMLGFFNKLAAATTPTQTAVRILQEQAIHIPVQAISCGVDTQYFRPQRGLNRAAVRQRYGLAVDKTLFLYIGRIDHEKDLDVLIRALSQVERQDIQVAIGGKGSHLRELQRLTAELGLDDGRVRFLGFVPDNDLPTLLNSADFFAMPSHAELQSIATLEAMACGLPVLAANARALPELVAHEQNGYLFEVGDVDDAAAGLLYLTERRAEWQAMSHISQEKAQPHWLGNTIGRYAAWYAQYAQQPVPAR